MEKNYSYQNGAFNDKLMQPIVEKMPIGNVSDVNVNALFDKFLKAYIIEFKKPQLTDEKRHPRANNSYGGLDFLDKETTALIRSTGWEMIKQIGRKIISGDFNLTTVSIPIKVMVPVTILQTIADSMFNFPLYFNIASRQRDNLEKFKWVIVASLSMLHKSNHFLKPMNPILGETYEMMWEDGSHVFLEQSSHHPPISHYIMYGPRNAYKYYGYSNFSSSAGLNSMKVINTGKRFVEFPDGTKIGFNFCQDLYSNSFWGTLRNENLGEIQYIDNTNGHECTLKFSSVKRKTSDHFTAVITKDGKPVSKIFGSWLSYIEFDDVRYWDIRDNVYIKPLEITNQLLSSSIYRRDRMFLERRELEEAQKVKEELENIQRRDRKLREAYRKKQTK